MQEKRLELETVTYTTEGTVLIVFYGHSNFPRFWHAAKFPMYPNLVVLTWKSIFVLGKWDTFMSRLASVRTTVNRRRGVKCTTG